MCLCVCVCSHAYVYVLSCPHLLPIHSAKEYERETETEKKRVCSPGWVMGVQWKDSRPLSFIFIHSPSPSYPSAATSAVTTPPTTTAHPPPPQASLCARREALLSSHACLLFPPGPPLPWFSSASSRRLVVFGTQLNKHTPGLSRMRGGGGHT